MSKLLDKKDNGVSQLISSKNEWAKELWVKGAANHWLPQQINMSEDIKQWKDPKFFSEDERLLIKRALGLFAAGESLVSNSIETGEWPYLTDAACRQYMIRKNWDESVHNWTVKVCCEAYNLSVEEVAEAYLNIPSIKAKEKFLMSFLSNFTSKDFDINTTKGKQKFLKNMVVFYLICEGTWFFSNFALLLAMGRQNKLPGLMDQINYSIRDECTLSGTELLTPKGWKKIDDVIEGELIAQYNKDGSINFTPIKKKSSHKSNTCYKFSNHQKHIDLMVSANHRLVVTETYNKKNNLAFRTAKDFNYHPYVKHHCAGKIAGKVKFLSFEDRLKIAAQADGHVSDRRAEGSDYPLIEVNISLKKGRKKKRLEWILSNLKYQWRKNDAPDGYTVYNLHLPVWWLECKKLTWVDLSDKDSNWCQEFIDEAAEWDGHWACDSRTGENKKNRITWGCVIPENSIILQTVASLAGYRTHYRVWRDDRSENFSDYHRLQILKNKDYIRGGKIEKEILTGDFTFYGVEVESGMILVKYNNCISVTGNSLHVEFGTKVLSQTQYEYPEVWTDEFKEEVRAIMKAGTEVEFAYAKEVLPTGILGITPPMLDQYIKFLSNMRLKSIGLKPVYDECSNPFTWLGEAQDVSGMSAFFERHEKSYQHGSALTDDL